MNIVKIVQKQVDFFQYDGEVSFDNNTNEIIIYSSTYKIFNYTVEIPEERFVPYNDDIVWITDQGLILQRDNINVNKNTYNVFDCFGWVDGDTFKYIIHP